jgi:hypothetical protein
MKIALICISCLCLAACETTSFQAPPVAEQACDSQLTGTWLSVGDKPDENGEVELRIDGKCQLLFIEHEKDGTKEGVTTQVHVGNDRDAGYLWVDSAWAVTRFDMKQPPPEGDIYLLRYRIRNDRLVLEAPDDSAIAHRIIDGKINGEVRRIDGNLNNRLLAPVDPAILRQRGFFDKEKAELRRATTGPTHE